VLVGAAIPRPGEIDSLILSYIVRLNSYTEISPSGSGIRVLVMAKLSPKHRRADLIEMYEIRRLLSRTGNVLSGGSTPVIEWTSSLTIEPRQEGGRRDSR
jgi:primase-polymerase (primpol)-like protein